MKLLLVEDDRSIVSNLTAFLNSEGFSVTAASGQRDAETRLAEGSFDLVLADIALADGNGLGADDYISKPFRPRELVSRIRSVLRRCGRSQSVVQLGSLSVDMEKGVVLKNGQDAYLSALEYRLLLIFLNNRGVVLSRSKLLEAIWDVAGDFVNDNTLTVYIKRLREKIEDDPQNPRIIRTVRGLGYKVD